MIIGFLGKGGSGKSTLSTKVVQYLNKNKDNTILAIDADYNMDLLHNLEAGDDLNFLGDDAKFLMKKALGVDEKALYIDIVLDENNANKFSISNPDEFTKKYSKKIKENLYIMAVGPHSENVLNDKMCSHGLGALLKAYLPLLDIKQNEYIIVDEKAGVDSVGTGTPSGFNMSIIVVEATVYGVKAAKQISGLLENHYHLPYAYIINKVKSDTDVDMIKKELDEKYIIDYIPFGENIDDIYAEKIVTYVQKYILENSDNRLTQSINKFKNNKSK
jgi:CO dehydrogenase nickel-insertion accessory protein CooC1